MIGGGDHEIYKLKYAFRVLFNVLHLIAFRSLFVKYVFSIRNKKL